MCGFLLHRAFRGLLVVMVICFKPGAVSAGKESFSGRPLRLDGRLSAEGVRFAMPRTITVRTKLQPRILTANREERFDKRS